VEKKVPAHWLDLVKRHEHADGMPTFQDGTETDTGSYNIGNSSLIYLEPHMDFVYGSNAKYKSKSIDSNKFHRFFGIYEFSDTHFPIS
jgi:hypothetical protein